LILKKPKIINYPEIQRNNSPSTRKYCAIVASKTTHTLKESPLQKLIDPKILPIIKLLGLEFIQEMMESMNNLKKKEFLQYVALKFSMGFEPIPQQN
jgi:hypothetical protein